MNRKHQLFGISVLAAAAAMGCKDPAPAEEKSQEQSKKSAPAEPKKPTISKLALKNFTPALAEEFPNQKDAITEEKIALGRMLYFEKRLSKNHDISCNSCHQLDKYGVDGEKTSPGHKGQRGDRNSPTVYNAAGHFVQFWDGRSPDVEDQATGPVLNPVEMALADEDAVKKVLSSMPEYVEAFKKAFPDDEEAITLKNAGRAIGAFERRLVTPAPWDKLLDGDDSALTDEQKEGFKVFTDVGCGSCHKGTLLGGGTYERVGDKKPWPNQEDQGRFGVTKKASDKMLFKTPSLRNITETAPYFHDGSAATIEEAVKMMGTHQLSMTLKDDQVKAIVAFFGALKGDVPADYIKEPKLPESTDKTPKPDPS